MAAPKGFRARVDDFCFKLEYHQIDGSLEIAKRATELMRQLVTSSRLSGEARAPAVGMVQGQRRRQGDSPSRRRGEWHCPIFFCYCC